MPTSTVFRVNYYVGAMLAQGGNLWLDGPKIVFSPTSAIDRAMGAKDVEIPFSHIREAHYTGVLSRAFTIKTDEKLHKFEGSQAKQIWDLLEKTLPNKELMRSSDAARKSSVVPVPAASSSTLVCHQCAKTLQACYSFCPTCGARQKSICSSCRHSIDPAWTHCAFCGWKFAANAKAA